MSTVVLVRIPAEEFALSKTLTELPEMEFEVERIVASESDRVMPFLWTGGDSTAFDRLDEVLAQDPTVEEERLLSKLDGERLYQMSWVSQIRVVIQILVEQNGTILKAHGHDNQWLLRILFPDRDALSTTHDFCEQYDLSLDIRNIFELRESPGGRYGLTEEQYRTLVTAAEMGYYEVPRGVKLEELAEELDITHQALSELLRRGHDTLIKDTLMIEEP
jgi:hypothetical protein